MPCQQYVGLAAKPGSVNERIERVSNALSSGKKAASEHVSSFEMLPPDSARH